MLLWTQISSLEEGELVQGSPQVRYTPKGPPTRKERMSRLTLGLSLRLSHLILVPQAIYGLLSLLKYLASSRHSVSSSANDAQTLEPCYCGDSISEAQKLGCRHDSLSTAWLPERCRDDELLAEFEHAGPGVDGAWEYWADRNHTHPLSLHEVSLLGDKQPELFHTMLEWHRNHCIFLWRKEHRAKFSGITFDPDTDNEEHIIHCGMMLLEDSYGTTAGVRLGSFKA